MKHRFTIRVFGSVTPALVLLLLSAPVVAASRCGESGPSSEGLSAAEFSRLSREFSEDGGYFNSDNFTSNETAYLTVIEKLRQLVERQQQQFIQRRSGLDRLGDA